MNVNRTKPDRRFFIKKSFLGAGALLFAHYLPLGCTRTPPAMKIYDELEFFSNEEAYLLSLIAERILPLRNNSERDLYDVIHRLDRFFVDSYPEDQKEFGRLLTVFNNPVFVFLFSGSLTSFDRMRGDRKDAYLRGWMVSVWGFRRTAFQALKRLLMSMYYTRDESWKEIGYDGPLV